MTAAAAPQTITVTCHVPHCVLHRGKCIRLFSVLSKFQTKKIFTLHLFYIWTISRVYLECAAVSAPRAGLLTVAALCTLQPPGYLTQAARSTPAVAWLLSKYIYTNTHHADFTSRTTITIIKGFLCQVINITPQPIFPASCPDVRYQWPVYL